MARLQSTAEFFNIAIQETLEATHQLLVDTAKREHGKILGASSRPIPFTRFVDGVKGASEESVKARGVIQYDYHRLEEVVEFAMQTLFDFSPVLKDEYRRAHTLFVDGVEVRNLESWQPGQDVVITNMVAYTRMIELGKMKMRVPGTDHVYERASIAVNRRYGNVANTKFTYRSPLLSYVPGGSNRAGRAALRNQPARRSAMAMERNSRVPALVFQEYV